MQLFFFFFLGNYANEWHGATESRHNIKAVTITPVIVCLQSINQIIVALYSVNHDIISKATIDLLIVALLLYYVIYY